jgi:hypothetical protein
MLAKIISSGALMLLLTGSALAYTQQGTHDIYAGHSNSAQPQAQTQQPSANNCKSAFSLPSWQVNGACLAVSNDMTARAAPYGYNDTQGSRALGGGPG